ncbi:hypothetical protein GobsT_42000 [Gemmata obscuriglobus]|nr:hypothetical protein GobsT_42000 [Gemmata obscuriglobus]VTS08481.1 unnamed protein product [Gemmata obscuriglobus UQM 2246]
MRCVFTRVGRRSSQLPPSAEVRELFDKMPMSPGLTLKRFATALDPGTELATLYRRRQDAETDIWNIKETLAWNDLRAKGRRWWERNRC